MMMMLALLKKDKEVSDSDDYNKAANQADDISDEHESDEDEELKENSTSLQEYDDRTAKDKKSKAQKRKFSDFDGEVNAACKSLRALKNLAGEKVGDAANNIYDGILSNEDFQRIKELKNKEETKIALAQRELRLQVETNLASRELMLRNLG
ncbi:SDA1 homolog isoform X1 [Olea europaea subsp. europaea]|uniref:SDA1 homolog isoform X1 n=1 Tax=Olea europaea subsp. europaea TaxID=158383 RepID=A0A8S0SG09_OLEEU|nr:SDA1 homolog isoform X1 [Olea europaea subsp. europaea]